MNFFLAVVAAFVGCLAAFPIAMSIVVRIGSKLIERALTKNQGPSSCDHDWLHWSPPQPIPEGTLPKDWDTRAHWTPTMEQFRLCSKCNLQQRSLT